MIRFSHTDFSIFPSLSLIGYQYRRIASDSSSFGGENPSCFDRMISETVFVLFAFCDFLSIYTRRKGKCDRKFEIIFLNVVFLMEIIKGITTLEAEP